MSDRRLRANCRVAALALVATLGVRAAPSAGDREQPEGLSPPPNIVLILADDLGYGDLGSYGAQDVRTPNLDRLAAEGVRFTAFYANAPVCTPTRAALLTGRYPQRPGGLETAIGLGNVGRYPDAVRLAAEGRLGLPPRFGVLPSLLKSAGYTAALVGKWHLGYEKALGPLAHGFDFATGPIGGAVDYFYHTEPVGDFLGHRLEGDRDFRRNGDPHDRSGTYLTRLLSEEAVRWLDDRHLERPFFLYVAYTAPHAPYQGPDDFRPRKLTEQEWNRGTRTTYVTMVEALDSGVGDILAKIAEMGVAERTVVIFFSDNGPTSRGSAGPFSGGKGTVFEGGIRVPCIVRWPGRLPAGAVSRQSAISMDLTASVLRVARAPRPNRPLDGIDILAHVESRTPDRPRTLFWRTRRLGSDRRAVRDGDMKYIHDRTRDGRVRELLFDLGSDPGERHDLSAERAGELGRLRSELEGWMERVRPER